MDIPEIDLRILKNTSIFLLDTNNETRARWIRHLTLGKDQVHIVTNNQTVELYKDLSNVSCVYAHYQDLLTTRSSYLVFDDCFPDSRWMNDRTINSLISFPRSLEITSVIGLRRHISIPPRIRWNIDIVCIGCISSRKRIYESFVPEHISFEKFCCLLDTYTQNQGLLVLRFDTIENGTFYAKL